MPYITEEEKNFLEAKIKALSEDIHKGGPGVLNYVMTQLITLYLVDGMFGYNYVDLNEIMGVLESVKAEFYRRVVVPYEEKKKNENGDVYKLPS